MNTINISLPEKLKNAADALIKEGHYASFSDLVRTSLRMTISENKYDRIARQAMDEYRKGRATVLRSSKDVDTFVKSVMAKTKK